jgi:hypothetical protein
VRQVGSGGNTYQAERYGCNDQKFKHIRSLGVRNSARQLILTLYQSAINRPTLFGPIWMFS